MSNCEVKSLQHEQNLLFKQIRAIVNFCDPIGLFPIDCAPEDEYDPEVIDIITLLPMAESTKELAQSIHGVFVKWFDHDMAGSIEKYIDMAEKLWKYRKQQK